MDARTGFRLPRILLPRPDIDLSKWAVVACDQYTAEPDYWRRVADEVGDAPSTLHLIFPEVFLGSADAPARIEPDPGHDAPLPRPGLAARARGRHPCRAHGGRPPAAA
jgi:hypothetical protein